MNVKKQGAYGNSELVAQVFCKLKTTLKIVSLKKIYAVFLIYCIR